MTLGRIAAYPDLGRRTARRVVPRGTNWRGRPPEFSRQETHVTPIERASRLRKTLTGICLIGAPLVGLTGSLVTPKLGEIEVELAYIATNPERWMAGTFVMLMAFFLLIPAVAGLSHLFRERWVVAGHAAAALISLGCYFHGAILGFALVEVPLVAGDLERSQLIAMTNQLFDHPAFVMLLVPFIGFYLGTILLAVSLWRAHIAPLWVSASMLAALASPFIAPHAVNLQLMFGLFLVSYGWHGLNVLQMSVARWEHGGAEAARDVVLVGAPSPAR
jgi:hypothetical protein